MIGNTGFSASLKMRVIKATRESWVVHKLNAFMGCVPIYAELYAKVTRVDGTVEHLGLIATHVVTDAFVDALVDTLQSSVATFSDFKYHDSGTGTNAEAAGDTALQTPTGEARDVGTQVEGSSTNIYKSIAENTYAGTFAITEHGLFNAAAVGTLMDRSKFTAINVVSGDKIEFTYQLTCTAGG